MGLEKIKRRLMVVAGLRAPGSTHLDLHLGEAAGATRVRVRDSAGTVVGYVDSDGGFNFAGAGSVTGTLTASSGFVQGLVTSSSQKTLTQVGVNLMSATGAASYTLPAPAAGLRMTLIKTAASTAILTVDTNSTGTTLDGSSATKILFDGNNQRAELLGLTTARWTVLTSTALYGGIST